MTVQPIKVLALVNSLGVGGAERILERTVNRLRATGRVAFTVCTLDDVGPIGERLRVRGFEVICLEAHGGKLGSVLIGVMRLSRLLRRRRFDLVHSFLYRSHLVARIANLLCGGRLPLVSAEHCVGDNRPRGVLAVNRLLSRLSDRIVVVSEAVKERAVRRDRIAPSKVRVVLNGIELPRPNPRAGHRLRRALGIAPSEIVFLMIGRLHFEKGPDVLLEALKRLGVDASFAWKAVLVGSGPERSNLERSVQDLGMAGRVLLAGERRNVGAWLEAADIVVLPSREEGLPMSALEALARLKPVVATRVGGTAEVVRDGVSGLLVPPEDPLALAAALRRLALDAGARRELGTRGRELVRSEFSLERMERETLRCYEELLPDARRAAPKSVGEVAVGATGE